MKETKSITTLIEYAKSLSDEKLFAKGDMISLRSGSNMYYTKPDCDFENITIQDIQVEEINNVQGKAKVHADIYLAREDINAICHCHPTWVCPVAKVGATIPAMLDDMAQIVGPSCKTSKNDTKSIIKTLKGRNSCLIKDDGCLTSGRTMSEAYTCVLVLDKACKCYVSSSVIGKNKIINGLESRLMRFVYKTKYSKKNQENIAEQEGE